MNPHLERQLRAAGLEPRALPRDATAWRTFLETVSSRYDEAVEGDAARAEEALRRKAHYDTLFARSPIATFEEDFTEVGTWLNRLREDGITDLSDYLRANPAELAGGAALVTVVDVNDAAVSMLRAGSAAELVGLTPARSHAEDSLASYQRQFEAIWADESYINFEFRGRRADGTPLFGIMHWSAPRFVDGLDLSKVTVAIVDITQRKESETRMAELVRSKDDFLASVSHEIRTPLTAVYGSAEALLDEWDRMEPELQRELVGFIALESAELAHMVEDLLVAAQADIGTVSVVPRVTDLRPLVDAVVDASRAERSRGEIEVVEVAGSAWADPLRLKQILRNLVTNAMRYGGERIRIRGGHDAESCVVTVADDGAGVPVERREAIFDLYERAHSPSGLTGSVGIGLAVSRSLARLMDGELEYDFADGWSVFRLVVPAAAASSTSAGA